jgi:hypothetical protein
MTRQRPYFRSGAKFFGLLLSETLILFKQIHNFVKTVCVKSLDEVL